MVQTSQPGIQSGFQGDNSHPGACECGVKDRDSREQEEEEREKDGAEEELVEIVVASVDAVAEDVALFAPEEVEERDDDCELPVVDPRGGDVETVDMDCEDRYEVGEHRDRHAGASEGRDADKADYMR